jgi:DNA-binding NarL/FixJ family response regulator
MAQRLRSTDKTPGPRVLLASADPSVHGWAQDCLPPGVTLCAVADDGSNVAELARASRADVCLLDLRLPGGALAALRALVAVTPALRIVVWGASDREPGLLDALDRGATGCIVGKPDCDALARVFADVVAGRPALPRAVVSRLVARLRLA